MGPGRVPHGPRCGPAEAGGGCATAQGGGPHRRGSGHTVEQPVNSWVWPRLLLRGRDGMGGEESPALRERLQSPPVRARESRRARSSPAAIATGSRAARLSREPPSSRESRGLRRRRAPPLARGLRERGAGRPRYCRGTARDCPQLQNLGRARCRETAGGNRHVPVQ